MYAIGKIHRHLDLLARMHGLIMEEGRDFSGLRKVVVHAHIYHAGTRCLAHPHRHRCLRHRAAELPGAGGRGAALSLHLGGGLRQRTHDGRA